MKYNEINLNRKLFGDEYLVYDWEEEEDTITIFVKSQDSSCHCPTCGKSSDSIHATYHRNLQMIPIRMKHTRVDVIAYKYDCLNKDCSRKVFMEALPFASHYQTRTNDLNSLILAFSIFMSNEGTSKVLKLLGIHISNDSIKRLYDKIEIEDYEHVESVGIDDVAIRKGQTYATAIYDAKTRDLIALLDGRDAETLKKWLRNHSKIKIVSRDRASAYAKAINEVLPECIQVADRFHLFQNLLERMKEVFKEELPKNIFIRDGKMMEGTIEKEKKLKVSLDSKILTTLSYDNTAPVDEEGNVIVYDNKNRNLNSPQYKKQAEGRKKNNK